MKQETTNRTYGSTGLWWRIGATAGLLSLSVLSTVRGASGAFEPASVPVADLTAQNGMIIGTTRMMGDRFLLYNGTRLESMAQSMEVNFERGGSMTLCPRSQLQILTANQTSGMMLAFQAGGTQMPFPLRMGDEVLTPDWRVELTSDSRKGDMGIVQVVTNRHGDLCMQGNSQGGAYFRVSQLIGDQSFRVAGGQSERFSEDGMQTSTDGCGCNAEFEARSGASPAANGANAPAIDPRSPAMPGAAAVKEIPVAALAQDRPAIGGYADAAVVPPAAQVSALAAKPRRRHPDDLAGYVGSFVHRIFGR
jgi:hypothetical protein